MKITQEHVGKKVRHRSWKQETFATVLYVGKESFFTEDSYGEESWFISDYWELYEEPKKKIRMAPALWAAPNGTIQLHPYLFESLEEAKNYLNKQLLKWPANDTMWVEVEV